MLQVRVLIRAGNEAPGFLRGSTRRLWVSSAEREYDSSASVAQGPFGRPPSVSGSSTAITLRRGCGSILSIFRREKTKEL